MPNALLKTFKSTLKTKLNHFPPKTFILPNEQAVKSSLTLYQQLRGSRGSLLRSRDASYNVIILRNTIFNTTQW